MLIDCISENVEALLGLPALGLCGAPLTALVAAPDAGAFAAKLREPSFASLNPHDLTLASRKGRPAYECSAHRCDGDRWLLELEPRASALCAPTFGEIHRPLERLMTVSDVTSLLHCAAEDMRALSGFDEAAIYRFDSDWRFEPVALAPFRRFADAVAPEALSEPLRRQLLRHPLHMIPDTRGVPARLVAKDARAWPRPDDLLRAALCAVPPTELDPFVRAENRAVLSIAITVRGGLWGLVTCRNNTPRRFGYRQRAACELVGHLLAWQLDVRLERERQRERERTAPLHAKIAAIADASSDLSQAVVEAAPVILDLLSARGIAIRAGGRVTRSGEVPLDEATLIEAAARLNARAENGVACARAPVPAMFIRLSADGSQFIMAFQPARPEGRAWLADEVETALTLRGRLSAEIRLRDRQHSAHLSADDGQRGLRAAQTAALIKLGEDVGAALPSRAAVVEIVLNFARRQTNALGSRLERLTETEIVCEAATGTLAPFSGAPRTRAGSLSGSSADLNAPLVCDDVTQHPELSDVEAFAGPGTASLLVTPVTVSETETLVLTVASAQRSAFTAEDITAVRLAAANLATALRAAHEYVALATAERQQRSFARRLRALHAIASTTGSNRKDQIDAALYLCLEQLDLDWAYLGVIDRGTQEFTIENSVSRDGTFVAQAGMRAPLGATLFGHVAQSKGVRIMRIMQDASQSRESPAFAGWSSYIAAPLFIGGVNYGTIGFTSREVRTQPFSEAHIEFVAVAGELISSAIERSLQREQLEASETRYRTLTEAIPEMVWVVDAAGRFEYVNERWTSYTGLTLEEGRARGPEHIYAVGDSAAIIAGRNVAEPAEYDCEARLRRHDGSYRWHLVRSVPFRDSGKWLVTASDIEERKSAESVMAGVHEAALAATQAKSRFLATMSHEIRTPMNAVIGMTELLLLTQLSDEQREYIEIVRDSGQSLLRVLNDILDYSKIEAGKLELESVNFDLSGQIESVVELLRAQYQIKGVRLTTRIGTGIPSVVTGDPGRLRQILLNLAGNALKFSAPGGRVHIAVRSAAADGEKISTRFTVEDTGIGIPPEIVARLFQPFSQGDESTTRKYGGTGLGLSICAQLVALMNGTIGVRSVPGEGSVFWFEIPLRGTKNSGKSPDARKRGQNRSKPIVMRAEKILLVEDNEINTFLALKQLQRIGFVVSAVNNGRQAVDAVTREHFDLVFMDCHMPEMDGFAATQEIRQLESGTGRHLPIVAMTADARTEDHQNCLRAGMDDYVSKPTSLDSLRAVLDRWLPNPDRRQSTRLTAARSGPAASLRLAKLLELFDGDREAVVTLLTAASGSIKADFARIENCVASGEFAAVVEAAHRLKGTSASIRSPQLGELSAAVERAAQADHVPDTLLAELRAAVESLVADVERHGPDLATIN
jgi:PAS domain S-box-containing protein